MSLDRSRAASAARARMAELRLSSTALSRAAGLDLGTVSDFLSGHRWPKPGTQGAIEAALDWAPGTIERVASGNDWPISAAQEGVRLALPDSVLEGLLEDEIREVEARATAEALKAAREIRQQHGRPWPLPDNVYPIAAPPGPGVPLEGHDSITRFPDSQPPDVDSPESRAVARKTGRKPHGGGRAGDDPDG
jgi:hypothetical protein